MTLSLTASRRVFLTAQWRWLAVLNYELSPALLAAFVPRGVELDFDAAGKTYVSLVAFRFEDTRVLGWSIPGHRNFEELNLRFYVQRKREGEVRRGVVFIKELVPRAAISWVARRWYNENYFTTPMRHAVTPGDVEQRIAPLASYEFRTPGDRASDWNRIRVTCHPEPKIPELSSHEAFILEHYYGYTRQRDGGTLEYRVDHPRWTVWPGAECEIDCDFGRIYGPPFAEVLSQRPDTVFVADGSAVEVLRPERVA